MRVSTIFAQGGGRGGRGRDCDCECDDYFRHRGDFYYNGYNQRRFDFDDDRGNSGGLLSGLLG